jgi:hypothetical protein
MHHNFPVAKFLGKIKCCILPSVFIHRFLIKGVSKVL